MLQEILHALLLSAHAHITSDKMRMLSNHSSVCLHVITDTPQHFLNLSIPRVLFSRDTFERRSSNLNNSNPQVCQATDYVLETDNTSAIFDLFQCERGKILPVRFVPYTKIYIYSSTIETLQEMEMNQTLKCFTELNAHIVELLNIPMGGGDPSTTVAYFQGEGQKQNGGNVFGYMSVNWRKWQPNFHHEIQTFKAGFHHFEPYVSINKVTGEYEGLDMYIMQEITRGWNVEYVIYPDMAFDMTIRDVRNHKLHTALCAVWHVRVPPEILDTSPAYAESCVTFIVPKPTRTMSRFFLIDSQPLSFWLVICLNFGISSAMLYIVNLFYNHFVDVKDDNPDILKKSEDVGFVSMVFIIYGALLLNTMDIPPKRTAERIVYVVWLIVVVVLTSAYSTGISSCLTVPQYSNTIITFKDIVKHKLVWAEDGSGNYEMFRHSADQNLATIANNSVGPGAVTSSNGIVYITNVLYQKYVNEYIPANSGGQYNRQLLKECAGLFNYVYPLQKHSSFKNIFDEKILMMVEGGLIKKWTDVLYWKHKNEKDFRIGLFESFKDEGGMLITFETIKGLLYIVIVAHFLCSCVFLMELLYKFRSDFNSKNY